jgi:hypothetical protein
VRPWREFCEVTCGDGHVRPAKVFQLLEKPVSFDAYYVMMDALAEGLIGAAFRTSEIRPLLSRYFPQSSVVAVFLCSKIDHF